MKVGDYCLIEPDELALKGSPMVPDCVGLLARITQRIQETDRMLIVRADGKNFYIAGRYYAQVSIRVACLRLVPPEVAKVVYGVEVKDESR